VTIVTEGASGIAVAIVELRATAADPRRQG
jgi:hypothetical protein